MEMVFWTRQDAAQEHTAAVTTCTRPEKDLAWMAEEVTKPTLSRGAMAIDGCWKRDSQLERVGFLRTWAPKVYSHSSRWSYAHAHTGSIRWTQRVFLKTVYETGEGMVLGEVRKELERRGRGGFDQNKLHAYMKFSSNKNNFKKEWEPDRTMNMYREMAPQGQTGLKSRLQLSHREPVITNDTYAHL